MKVFIGENRSCDLNSQYDRIYHEFSPKKLITEKVEEADIIIFASTCCGTNFQIMNTIDYINKILANKKEGATTYLTGCMARNFIDDNILDVYKRFIESNIDYVIPQNDTDSLLNRIFNNNEKKTNTFGDLSIYANDIASLYISNGCLNRCTFCKTTFSDYPLVSSPIEDVKDTIDALDEYGIEELQIRGTNISQYGLDLNGKYMLPDIIEYVNTKNGINKLSLMGFAFSDSIRGGFADTMRDSSKIYKIVGSLESGSDPLLNLMNKGFTSQEIISFINEIRKKYEKKLHLNIIAGFPTETLKDVINTLEVLKQLDPYLVSICYYNNSSFVSSNRFPQLKPEQIEEHAKIYSKVLKKRNVRINTIKNGYQYNSQM